ncbi:DDE-1 domain-containing protein [Aphis craccivora]|uniref:DDE-1 domain-containing protein n=1 Tax=Aphis craccivora TaxID=307492 RepID=A0A6G0XMP0_APHCR|nr:DDE-1 domain-containing protein [Aphis craccivora]
MMRSSPENPILLIYDGHSSHVDLSLMETAVKNNVTILLLPPHTSHLFQPMNLAVFKLVKSTWDQRLCNWSRHHQGQKLLKSELSKLMG